MLFKSLVFAALVLGGCAQSGQYMTMLDTPETTVALTNPQVVVIKDTPQNRLREGTLLVANRSPVWREVRVFNEHPSPSDLVEYDADGLPTWALNPIGSFDMSAAEGYRVPSPQYTTKLLGGFYSGQRYTLVILSVNMSNQVLGRPQFCYGTINTEPFAGTYSHYNYLGVNVDRKVSEPVSNMAYLPDKNPREYRGTNMLKVDVDINLLLQRGIHRLTNP